MSEALKVCVLSRSQLGWPWRAKKTIPVRINWFVRCFGERLRVQKLLQILLKT